MIRLRKLALLPLTTQRRRQNVAGTENRLIASEILGDTWYALSRAAFSYRGPT